MKAAFDLQVNGYAGVDFNTPGLTLTQLQAACAALEEDGVDGILATVITDHIPAMVEKLAGLAALREEDETVKRMIAGFHIEGPFINPEPGYRGAHPHAAIHAANRDEMEQLLEAASGLAKLVTLAPENDPDMATTKFLADQGIVVSGGHCNPTLDQMKAAIDAGLTMFTHLGNGCPMQMHRHDNIIQRVLSLSDRLWCCYIPDGVHVDFFALSNYLKVSGVERSIMVTDAISAARLGPGRYTLAGWDLVIGEDLVARAPDASHFVGSTVTMPRIRENLAAALELSDDEIDTLISGNPRRAMSGGPPS